MGCQDWPTYDSLVYLPDAVLTPGDTEDIGEGAGEEGKEGRQAVAGLEKVKRKGGEMGATVMYHIIL
ncbi:hypothetical protein Pmani_035012 [Petrolisthes manimaculis]|uniref:Uncharacterized protein n=1 Tax=Petrolisthes manimaculis TaxID=1843537 RepID=A0AAE1TNU1_9EUCA|nr:hypothetical protein Pmani_035012 [Petrolisthes manimaculis]